MGKRKNPIQNNPILFHETRYFSQNPILFTKPDTSKTRYIFISFDTWYLIFWHFWSKFSLWEPKTIIKMRLPKAQKDGHFFLRTSGVLKKISKNHYLWIVDRCITKKPSKIESTLAIICVKSNVYVKFTQAMKIDDGMGRANFVLK